MKHLAILSAVGLSLTACATDPNTGESVWGNTARGAAIGAIAGAGVGVLAGGDDGRNAAIGAAVGAIAGGAAGVYMDKQEAEMRRKTAGTGIEVARNGDQLELLMPSDVTFAVNQSAVQPQFMTTLDEVAGTLVAYPSTAIDVVGHADSTGAETYNQQLSEARAQSVSSYLISQGVQDLRLASYGVGETQPIASNETAAGRAANRRVQIVLTPVTQ